jgi:transcriptional regulator with XRE-family HTH domain
MTLRILALNASFKEQKLAPRDLRHAQGCAIYRFMITKNKKAVAAEDLALGNSIRRRREAMKIAGRKLSMEALGLMLEPSLSEGQISKIETGKSPPNYPLLRKIAKALRTTAGQLISEAEKGLPDTAARLHAQVDIMSEEQRSGLLEFLEGKPGRRA